MVKRVKKPLVEPTKRREWFRRYEDGESATSIAKADSYDPRTVRKQIEVERQIQEEKEARTFVLRQAMENHYADLYNLAQKLDAELSSERSNLTELKGNPMWSALREHLPRSVIWKNLDRLEELRKEKERLEQILNKYVEKQIESGAKNKLGKSPQETGLGWRNTEALSACIRDAALGMPEVLSHFDCNKISEDAESAAIKMIKAILRKAPTWEKYKDLSQLWVELERVQRILHDELTVIRFKRVVPGRCRYCPL